MSLVGEKDLGLYNGLHLLNFTTVFNLYATNLRSCVCSRLLAEGDDVIE